MDQKQQEDHQSSRRSKLSENQDSAHHHHPPPPPQKCPRCDSLHTKFCYYNNYSLSQPRYFCKTCRRYWTQGGTLRNVPVGGGCRKGKRPRSTTSSPTGESSSRSQPLPPPPPLLPLHLPTNPLLPWARGISCINTGMIAPPGGLFSSLPTMQSFTQQQGTNQAMDLTGGITMSIGSSADAKTSIFQGFSFPLMKSQLDQPLQIQLDSGFPEKEDEEKNLIGSWNHRENINNNPSTSNIDFWNSPSGSTTSDGMPCSSLEANPWPNFPGFGNPP